MTVELARLLLSSGAVARAQIQSALFVSLRHGVPFPRALLREAGVDQAAVERELAVGDTPLLRTVVPLIDAIARLPVGMCTRLLAIPVRADPITSTIDVATANPLDPHVQAEFAFHLQAPIRLIRAPLSAMNEALNSFEGQLEVSSHHAGHPTTPFVEPQRRDTPAFGSPARSPESRASDVPIPLVRRSLAPHKSAEASDVPPLVVQDPARAQRSTSARPASGSIVDSSPALARLRVARSRDEVIALIVEAMRTVAHRTGVLVLRRNQFVGWMCTPELSHPRTFAELRIPLDQPSALSAAASKGWFLGHIPPVPPHEPLLKALGTPAYEVSLVAVKVADRTVMLILSTDLRDTLTATRLADLLAREAGEALSRILSSEKRSR
ncbi:MAG: hypothetical protein HY898_02090 [Deltaproteobacteria bacterium]|nr:hypothetical protein [Deltaproteobacteria bacterium]